jgi:hypothetical protein
MIVDVRAIRVDNSTESLANSSRFLSIYNADEIIRRVGNSDRIVKKRMAAGEGARNFMTENKVCAVPRRNCLVLNSETNSAEVDAQEIARHFSLADL